MATSKGIISNCTQYVHTKALLAYITRRDWDLFAVRKLGREIRQSGRLPGALEKSGAFKITGTHFFNQFGGI